MSHTTISISTLNRLARQNRRRLFRGLERYVNLRDNLEEYQAFARGWPTFYPAYVHGMYDRFGAPEFHRLVLIYRDCLRRVWCYGQGPSDPTMDRRLGLLLGIKRAENFPDIVAALEELHKRMFVEGSNVKLAVPVNDLWPDWATGEFRYDPANDFQKAVYLLFRESWRARLCRTCGQYFIADKPPQMYCSTSCYGDAKRKRNLDRWKNIYSEKRKKRAAEKRKKRQQSGK